jgi:anti-sigma B factor antagonist
MAQIFRRWLVAADFSRDLRDVGGVHLVTLKGELDMATAEGLAAWLVTVSGSAVVVDLSNLTFMDSSGISALVMARNRMIQDGNDLILTRPQPMVQRALEVVGLAGWLAPWDPGWGAQHGVTPYS